MMNAGALVRFRRLDKERRRLLLRAAALLTAASMAVSVLPFRIAIRFGCVPLGRRALTIDDCVWAVEAAARRLPWRTVCIEQGLVAQRLMRSAGLNAVLHYGARRTANSGKLEAHVWVCVAGEAIIGGQESARFAELSSYS